MIVPFTVIPIEQEKLNKDYSRKQDYLRDIISFWDRYGCLYMTDELKNYIQTEIKQTPLRVSSTLSSRFLNTLDKLPKHEKKVDPFNLIKVEESMKNGAKDFKICFNDWDEVLIKIGDIVNKVSRVEFGRSDYQRINLPDNHYQGMRDANLFKHLAIRWTPWLRQMAPVIPDKGTLEIVIYDHYFHNYGVKNPIESAYIPWLMDLINKNVQFDVELKIMSINTSDAFKKQISDLLGKYEKIISAIHHIGGEMPKSPRHLRVEDTVMTFDHPPTSHDGSKYEEHFERAHWPRASGTQNPVSVSIEVEKNFMTGRAIRHSKLKPL